MKTKKNSIYHKLNGIKLALVIVVSAIFITESSYGKITINISNIKNNSFYASWTPVPNATHYEIKVQRIVGQWFEYGPFYYESIPGYPVTLTSNITGYFVDDANIESRNVYDNYKRAVIIDAWKGDEKLEYSYVEFRLLPEKTGRPAIENVSFTSFDVKWQRMWPDEPGLDNSDYRISISKEVSTSGSANMWEFLPGFPKTIKYPDPCQVALTGLETGTLYKINLQRYANCPWGYEAWTEPTEQFVLTKPSHTEAYNAVNVNPSSFIASWKAVRGARYKLYVYNEFTKQYVYEGKEFVNTTTSTVVSGLSQETDYSYWVRTFNTSGESATKSNIVHVKTTEYPAPEALSATNITETSFKARWTPVNGATEYHLFIHQSGGDWIIKTTATSADVTGLSPNTKYDYRVRAMLNNQNWGLSETIEVYTKPEPTNALEATNVGTNSFTANWEEVAGAIGYKLWVFSAENTGFNPTGFFPKDIEAVNSFTLNGLQPAHSYRYFVQVKMLHGISGMSNTIQVDTEPGPPAALSAVNQSSSFFTASWDEVQGATSYLLFVENTTDNTMVAGYNGVVVNGNFETITGLPENKTYNYWVVAMKNDVQSAPSAKVAAQTIKQTAVQYTVSLLMNPTGAGVIGGQGTYNDGSTVTIKAKANPGYEFENWSMGRVVVSTQAKYAFTINGNKNLTANFKENPINYTLATNAYPEEGGNTSGAGTFPENSEVTVSAVPATGYDFVKWSDGENDISFEKDYTFTLRSNKKLKATFEKTKYQIELAVSPEGSGMVSGDGSFYEGASVTAVAQAAEGFEFEHWLESGNIVKTQTNYSFNANKNRLLVASFKQTQKNCNLSLNESPVSGGTTSGAGTFEAGTQVTVIANPSEDYSFINWTENGTEVSTNPEFTFYIGENTQLTANFVQQEQSYQVALFNETPEGGTITGEGTYEKGQQITVQAVANNGFGFSYWTEGVEIISVQPDFSFDLLRNRTLSAFFYKLPDTLKINVRNEPESGGTVSGVGFFFKNDTVQLKANAAEGYQFVNWTENGTEVSTNENYSFVISENREIVANYRLTTDADITKLQTVKVYPNPASDYIKISGLTAKSTILLYDFTGKLVKIVPNYKADENILVNELNPGIYVLWIDNDKNSVFSKIIIQ